MGASNSKIECICRPAQSGKTRTYQELIKDYELLAELFHGCDGFINIVLCSNNRSLVQQTAARHAADLYENSSVESEDVEADDRIEGSVFSWFSGTSKNNVSVRDLAFRILKGEVSMVVCCGHMKRISYLYKLIKELNDFPAFNKKINIWIDEADESIKKWSKPDVDASRLPIVNTVTLISATFDSIIKKYGKVRVRGFDVAHPECYIGFKDCKVEIDDSAGSAINYLEAVYEKKMAVLCKPGMRLFAPGDITQESHEQIAAYLGKKGWSVLILNGARKEIIKPNGTILPIADHAEWENDTPEEIGKTITRIYHDSGLANYPFAITGQICLSRGLTFQNNRFLFDYGVVPNMGDRATAYQCAARMFGNIKNFEAYKQASIVTTTRMKKWIEQGENIAMNIGRVAAHGELAVVDNDAMKRIESAGEDANFSVEWNEFASFAEAKEYGHHLSYPKHTDADGFILSSISTKSKVLSYDEVMRIKNGKKTAGFDVRKLKVGKSANTLYTCYRNVKDNSSVVFVVCKLTRNT